MWCTTKKGGEKTEENQAICVDSNAPKHKQGREKEKKKKRKKNKGKRRRGERKRKTRAQLTIK